MAPDYSEFLAHRAAAAAATEELIRLILSGTPGSYDRVEAAEILGYRRCSAGIPALLGMLREGWWTNSVAAAEALVKIGESSSIPHIERVYEECKATCSGMHLHFDAKRQWGILAALLRSRSEADLKLLLQHGDRSEGLLAGRELAMRRTTRRLTDLLHERHSMAEAVVALHESGEAQGWTIPFAVMAITGLPHEDARYLVYCVLHDRNMCDVLSPDSR